MCDGCPGTSSPFPPLGESRLFFPCGALVLWPLQVARYICKRQIPNVHVPHFKETNTIQCNRPYDAVTCDLHTARMPSVISQVVCIALILCTTSVAQGQPDCVSKIVVSCHLSRAMSLAPHRTPGPQNSHSISRAISLAMHGTHSTSSFFLCSRSPKVAHIQKCLRRSTGTRM